MNPVFGNLIITNCTRFKKKKKIIAQGAIMLT